MASGSINLTSSKAWAGRIDWSSTSDIASNSSTVTVTVYTWKTDGYATSGSGSFSGSVTVAGTKKTFTYLQEEKSGQSNRGTWGFTIYHNDDGTKSISISASISGPGSTSLSGVTLSGSQTVTLDQIARASTFSATDAAIGSTSQITIIRKATTITHRIKVTFGSLVGYITNTGGWSTSVQTISGTSVGFTIPDDFYQQIPNSTEGDCSMVLYTLYGSTVVATSDPITVHITTVESRCNPTISVTKNTSLSDDASALTGDSNKYIRHYSKVVYDMTRAARFGASITKIWVDIPSSVSGTRFTFNPISADTFTFWAQDSRGYKNSTTVTISLVSYVDLTNNATAGRPNPTDGSAFISFSGDYFNKSFGRVNNTLSIKYRITYPDGSQSDLTPVTPSISGDSYSAYVQFSGFGYQNVYGVYVEVTDRIKTVTKNLTIKQGIPVFDWGRNDFQFHVPVFIDGGRVDCGTVLFEDYAGAAGEVALTEPVTNYDYIEIFFVDNNGRGANCLKVYQPENKEICLMCVEPSGASAMYVRRTAYSISGNKISPISGKQGYLYCNGQTWTGYSGQLIRVIQVVGWGKSVFTTYALDDIETTEGGDVL